jgi:hypothetical protein
MEPFCRQLHRKYGTSKALHMQIAGTLWSFEYSFASSATNLTRHILIWLRHARSTHLGGFENIFIDIDTNWPGAICCGVLAEFKLLIDGIALGCIINRFNTQNKYYDSSQQSGMQTADSPPKIISDC